MRRGGKPSRQCPPPPSSRPQGAPRRRPRSSPQLHAVGRILGEACGGAQAPGRRHRVVHGHPCPQPQRVRILGQLCALQHERDHAPAAAAASFSFQLGLPRLHRRGQLLDGSLDRGPCVVSVFGQAGEAVAPRHPLAKQQVLEAHYFYRLGWHLARDHGLWVKGGRVGSEDQDLIGLGAEVIHVGDQTQLLQRAKHHRHGGHAGYTLLELLGVAHIGSDAAHTRISQLFHSGTHLLFHSCWVIAHDHAL
mmetsp:Transcript_36781/g.57418  ORF Transcript_36781/g.57418 Transcript_36781/m.57418 type:complete len:249 (-) Transcript_36781:519-1265(-)